MARVADHAKLNAKSAVLDKELEAEKEAVIAEAKPVTSPPNPADVVTKVLGQMQAKKA